MKKLLLLPLFAYSMTCFGYLGDVKRKAWIFGNFKTYKEALEKEQRIHDWVHQSIMREVAKKRDMSFRPSYDDFGGEGQEYGPDAGFYSLLTLDNYIVQHADDPDKFAKLRPLMGYSPVYFWRRVSELVPDAASVLHLAYAVKHDNDVLVRFLIEQGVNVMTEFEENGRRKIAFTLALEFNSYAVAKELYSHRRAEQLEYAYENDHRLLVKLIMRK